MNKSDVDAAPDKFTIVSDEEAKAAQDNRNAVPQANADTAHAHATTHKKHTEPSDEMSRAELVEMAQQRNVEIGAHDTKDEIIKALRKAAKKAA